MKLIETDVKENNINKTFILPILSERVAHTSLPPALKIEIIAIEFAALAVKPAS